MMGAKELMATYPWPGNVREIENFVKRLLVLYSQDEIDQSLVRKELETLTQTLVSPIPSTTSVPPHPQLDWRLKRRCLTPLWGWAVIQTILLKMVHCLNRLRRI